MDYRAEQEMEIEALQAILMDDLQELEGPRPEGWPAQAQCYLVIVSSASDADPDGKDGGDKKVELVWAHTPNYPDEPPLVKARRLQGLSDAELSALACLVDEQVEANLGMAMIYSIFSAVQEWLQQHATATAEPSASVSPEEARKAAEEAEERRLAEIRSHGTPVTPETFAAWKARCAAEAQLAQAKASDAGPRLDKGPTGKQYFLQLEASGRQVAEDRAEEEAMEAAAGEEGKDEEEEDFSESEGSDDEFVSAYLESKRQVQGEEGNGTPNSDGSRLPHVLSEHVLTAC